MILYVDSRRMGRWGDGKMGSDDDIAGDSERD